MLTRALGSPAGFGVLSLLCFCLILTGCSTQPTIACAGASGGAQCTNPNLFLYATTTSNQVLPFSISPSGSLTALTPAAGPANSGSIANLGFFLMFADPSGNAVDSDQINGTGTLTAVPGSPFSLGTAAGGPTSILAAPYGFFYATEPNGSIVGFTTPNNGTLTAPVPNSPFAAGVAPSQMAVATLAGSAAAPNALYVSDAADISGGILAFTIDSAGSLSPIAGSPFSASPNAAAGSVLVASPYLFVLLTSYTSLTNLGYVAVLAIDLNTGALTPVPGSPFAVGNAPAALAEDSSNHLFVLNTGDHTVSAFSIASNGVLTAIGAPVAAGTATGGIALLTPYLLCGRHECEQHSDIPHRSDHWRRHARRIDDRHEPALAVDIREPAGRVEREFCKNCDLAHAPVSPKLSEPWSRDRGYLCFPGPTFYYPQKPTEISPHSWTAVASSAFSSSFP